MDHIIAGGVNLLNTSGRAFCAYAWNALLQSSVLIAALLLLELVLRRRVRAVVRYAVWLLVFVKLLLPPTLALPTGIAYHWPRHTAALRKTSESVAAKAATTPAFRKTELQPALAAAPRGQATPVGDAEASALDAVPGSEQTAAVQAAIVWQSWVFLAWIGGLLALGICLLRRFRYVGRLVGEGTPASASLQDIAADCAAMLGLRRCPQLRLSKHVPGPVVCGLVRPVVLMPVTFPPRVSEERLRVVLVHELAHIKRADLWVNFVQTLLLVAYFYHPLLWLVNAIVRRLREQAVDETVLVALDAEAEGYSTALIDLAEMTFKRPILGLRLIGIAESRKALEERIRHMMTRPKPHTARVGALGLLAIVAVAAVLLPMARAQSRRISEVTVSQPNSEATQIPSEFKVTLPDGVTVELVGLCLPPSGQGQRWWRPDGTPMDGSEYEPRNILRTRRQALGYLLRFSGSDQVSYRVPMQVDELLFHPSRGITDGWVTVAARHSDNSMTGLPLSDRIDLQVDVAGGKWETSEGIGTARDWIASGMGGMGGVRGREEMKRELCPRSLYFPDGKAAVLSGLRPNPEATGPRTLIEMTSTAIQMDVRLQCVTADGVTREAQVLSVQGGGPTGMLQYACGLDAAMEDVERLVFRYRPYHRVTFKSVSLRPGEKTELQIQIASASEAEDEPGSRDGEDLEARAVSRTQLLDLGKALLIYANDHDDRFPEHLTDLRDEAGASIYWLLENVTYLGKGILPTDHPARVLAYDRTLLKKGHGTNVLYVDARVAFETPETFEKLGIRPALTSTAVSQEETAEQARETALNHLRQLALAAHMFADDHSGIFVANLAVLEPYLAPDKQLRRWIYENAELVAGDGKLAGGTESFKKPLAYWKNPPEAMDGTAVAFQDGHAEFVGSAQLEELGIEIQR